MSFSLKITSTPLLNQQGLKFNKFKCTSISRFPIRQFFHFEKYHNSSLNSNLTLRIFSFNDQSNAYPNDVNSNLDQGSNEESESSGGSFKSSELLKKLKRYGLSGVLSYGLLNTVYYLTTFLLVWFYVAPAPGKMGYFAAVERFLKVMAMVWAASQVTKLVRAGGALALAPFVDTGLSWFTDKFKFESQGKAFMAIVGICFGLAFIVFLVVTLLWA